MSDRFKTDRFEEPTPDAPEPYPPLPAYLTRRILRPGEKVTWVRGPNFTPAGEQYLTHVGLVGVAFVMGAIILGLGVVTLGKSSPLIVVPALVAGGLFMASLFVVGICTGYFTRLVVTTERIVIIQGHDTVRSWDMDRLPRRLLRYRAGDGGRSIDLDAVKDMLSNFTEKLSGSTAIMAFGKQINQIKPRDDETA